MRVRTKGYVFVSYRANCISWVPIGTRIYLGAGHETGKRPKAFPPGLNQNSLQS